MFEHGAGRYEMQDARCRMRDAGCEMRVISRGILRKYPAAILHLASCNRILQTIFAHQLVADVDAHQSRIGIGAQRAHRARNRTAALRERW